AFSHRGLGRVASWTSDLAGEWAAAWRADPAFPARFAQWIASPRPALAASAAPRPPHRPTPEPAAPLPGEAAWLEAWAGMPLGSIGSFLPPGPTIHTTRTGLAEEHARLGILALLGLLLVEFLVVRRHRRHRMAAPYGGDDGPRTG